MRCARTWPTSVTPTSMSSSLDGTATVTLRAAAVDEGAAERLEQELRLRAHRRLRALGVWT